MSPTIGGRRQHRHQHHHPGVHAAARPSWARAYADFLSNEDLADLVSEYNTTIRRHARRPRARPVCRPTSGTRPSRCPTDYELGDMFSSQDVRVTKTLRLGGRTQLRLIGEVFNVFNVSNLTNFNFNLVGAGDVRQGEPACRADVRIGRPARGAVRRARQFLRTPAERRRNHGQRRLDVVSFWRGYPRVSALCAASPPCVPDTGRLAGHPRSPGSPRGRRTRRYGTRRLASAETRASRAA